MKETTPPDRLQGQLIATNVLLEAILRTLPAAALKEIVAQHAKAARETADTLLNTQASEPLLEELNHRAEANDEQLRHIWRGAIQRDSAAGRL